MTGEHRFRQLATNQLPRIEQEQNHDVTRIMNNPAPTDAEVTEKLLADGGQWSPRDLADELGRHIDTVYRTLQRLGDLVIHEYGDVRLRSKNVAQQILTHLKGAKESFDISLSEAADRMLQADKVDQNDFFGVGAVRVAGQLLAGEVALPGPRGGLGHGDVRDERPVDGLRGLDVALEVEEGSGHGVEFDRVVSVAGDAARSADGGGGRATVVGGMKTLFTSGICIS